ncbi:MAG: hypothetical protein NVV68_12415 [Dokdonella sp.]|nr:hypothetical protein [Dokdonella sp.]
MQEQSRFGRLPCLAVASLREMVPSAPRLDAQPEAAVACGSDERTLVCGPDRSVVLRRTGLLASGRASQGLGLGQSLQRLRTCDEACRRRLLS